ncbi:MAG: 50S ribosomal protein L32 [Myxococcota bacterium]|nr:50S ribosomal protein L32 [Myxococcota bacterium]
MAVPKRRKSKSKRDSRRATHKISATPFSTCGSCGAPKQSHRVCTACGVYRERSVLEVEEY